MQAPRDENRVPTLMGTLNTDGETPQTICADSSSHALCVNDSTTGSDNGGNHAVRDENRVPVLMATSSVDGVTPVAVYADEDKNLLINSN